MNKQQVVTTLKKTLATDAKWATRGLVRIFQEQTESEKATDHTSNLNGVGFNGTDAFILSQFAKAYGRWNRLSEKQMAIVHKKMPRYAGQLVRLVGQEKIAEALAKRLQAA